ncbi:MAG: helix-turn-helix transcriptional regulator [Verrucomicrobia bacterium]|jgi:AraC-like DNA-binding protein|nr:helix-turn-helix transcriptional regulator [Verrucomicrobiota bacterium]
MTTLIHSAETECIWRVLHFGHDRIPPGTHYWWSNKNRQPSGTVVFQLTVAGELLYESPDGVQRAPVGHALLHAYDEPTAYGTARDTSDEYRSTFITFRGEGVQQHWDSIRREHGAILNIPTNGEIHTQLQQLLDAARPRLSADPTTIGSMVYSFIMTLFRHARASKTDEMRPVDRALSEILSNTAYNLSLKELAVRHRVSREHLSRVFHERTGKTAAAYMAEARLQRALWLLKNSNATITSIARQSGYASPHTLARQVRAATGHAPSALRSETTNPQLRV